MWGARRRNVGASFPLDARAARDRLNARSTPNTTAPNGNSSANAIGAPIHGRPPPTSTSSAPSAIVGRERQPLWHRTERRDRERERRQRVSAAGTSSSRAGKIACPSRPHGIASRPPANTFLRHPPRSRAATCTCASSARRGREITLGALARREQTLRERDVLRHLIADGAVATDRLVRRAPNEDALAVRDLVLDARRPIDRLGTAVTRRRSSRTRAAGRRVPRSCRAPGDRRRTACRDHVAFMCVDGASDEIRDRGGRRRR